MNALKNLMFLILGLVLLTNAVNAQNYKAPMIDASGNFNDKDGKKLGTFTKDGLVDAEGNKIAHLDAAGNLIDASTGKGLGKAQKNGNFVYHFNSEKEGTKFSIGAPLQGICEVKNEKGEVVLLVHENYKAQAACAFHCAQMKKDGKSIKMHDHSDPNHKH